MHSFKKQVQDPPTNESSIRNSTNVPLVQNKTSYFGFKMTISSQDEELQNSKNELNILQIESGYSEDLEQMAIQDELQISKENNSNHLGMLKQPNVSILSQNSQRSNQTNATSQPTTSLTPNFPRKSFKKPQIIRKSMSKGSLSSSNQ